MKTKYLVLALTIILSVCSVQAQWWRKKCKALVLEGGGDKGAYQVGALRGLVDNLPPKEVEYDVVTGVSIGAINAVGFSFFKKGDEDAASAWLSKY